MYLDYRNLPIETGVIMMYNKNEVVMRAFFHAFLKHRFQLANIQLRNATYEDVAYKSSDVHFEIELCDTMLKFIKQITKNRPINDNPFMFFILNFQDVSKSLQQSLRRLMDSTTANTVFVMATTRLSRIDHGLMSRSTMINLFKMKKPLLEEKIQAVENAIEGLLDSAKKMKPLDKILKSRELAYKLFHVNYPIEKVALTIVNYFSRDEAIIPQVVKTCAEADAHSQSVHKDILCYEQLLLECIHKYILVFKPSVAKRHLQQMSLQAANSQIDTLPTATPVHQPTTTAVPSASTVKKVSIKLKKTTLSDT